MPFKEDWRQTHISRKEIAALIEYHVDQESKAVGLAEDDKAQRHRDRLEELRRLYRRKL